MRTINQIIIHCSATPPDMDIGMLEINEWHLDRGWSGIGYHWVIRRDGTLERGRNEKNQGAHVRGHNKNSIGICLVGGKGSKHNDYASDHYNPAQLGTLLELINTKMHEYPDVTIHGHNEFSSKACPGFNVSDWWGPVKPAASEMANTSDVFDTCMREIKSIQLQLATVHNRLLDEQHRRG